MRHSALETRYLTTQNLVTGIATGNLLVAEKDDLANLLHKALTEGNREVLEPHERLRFNTFFFGVYNQYDFAYHQHAAGRLEADVWDRMEREITTFLGNAAQAEWWAQDKTRFSTEFVAFVDRRLAEATPLDAVPTLGAPPVRSR